jgi:thiamine transporter ThiT
MVKFKTMRLMIAPLIFAGAIARTLMAGMPNIEPVMLVTLVAGVKYGMRQGLVVGLFTMMLSDLFIYGAIPYFALAAPLGVLALVSLSTNAAYAAVGALSGLFRSYRGRLQLVGLAAWLTVLYDVITNSAWAFITGISLPVAFVAGMPFMIAHVLGNMLIVGIAAPYLIEALDKAPAMLGQFLGYGQGKKAIN